MAPVALAVGSVAPVTTFNAQAIQDYMTAHATATGLFSAVSASEQVGPPETGIAANVWLDNLRPVPAQGGLNVITLRVDWNVEMARNALAAPPHPGATDPLLMAAAVALLTEYCGDLRPTDGAGGFIGELDPLGIGGDRFTIDGGFRPVGDRYLRTLVLKIGIEISDCIPLGTQ